MIQKLSKDSDFEKLYSKAILISSKITSTNSKELIKKLANQSATEEEQEKLFKNLNFRDIEDFKMYAKEIFEAGQNIQKKFPELAERENKTEIIVSAILQNEQLKQQIKPAQINKVYQFEDCLALIVLANLCWTNFPYDYEAAFNCWVYFLGLFDFCAIFAE